MSVDVESCDRRHHAAARVSPLDATPFSVEEAANSGQRRVSNVTMQISMPAGVDGDDEDTAMGEAAEAPAAEQPLQGIVGWFDVEFRGSEKNPAQQLHPPVVLSTAPDASGATHWGQQLFPVAPGAVTVRDGDVLHAEVKLERREENHRLLRLYFDMCKQPKGTRPKDVDWNAQVALRWNID